MRIAPRTFRWTLVFALPLAAAAALRVNDADHAPGQDAAAGRPDAAARAARPAARDPALPRLELDRLQTLARRHVSVQEPVDPFAAAPPAASTAARAAVAPAPPPPPPQAPPLPFRFIGRQDADGVPLVFLEQQQQTHIVRIGETVAERWRLEAADVRELVFTYVPLGQQRRLATGSPG